MVKTKETKVAEVNDNEVERTRMKYEKKKKGNFSIASVGLFSNSLLLPDELDVKELSKRYLIFAWGFEYWTPQSVLLILRYCTVSSTVSHLFVRHIIVMYEATAM